jgi:ABC-type transporter Mla MlaB component
MFRITSHIADDEHVLKVEGCLEGACVRELDACWREAAQIPGRRVRVDLRDVCHVDAAGFELMTVMYRAARFVTKDASCGLVREISEAVEADFRRTGNTGLAAEARRAKAARS